MFQCHYCKTAGGIIKTVLFALINVCYNHFFFNSDKKVSGKPKEELGEKKHEIDKRLDVTGHLSTKKGKKGKLAIHYNK